MGKEEEFMIGPHKAKFSLRDPKDIIAGQKRIDKLNAMRITMTYIEIQRRKATPEQVKEIADKFLKWLEK